MTDRNPKPSITYEDRKFIVDFWYWIAEKQNKNTSHSDDKQLYKKLQKCREAYEHFYPKYKKDGRGTQPEFEELLSYVHRHLMVEQDGHGWLVYNYVRASLHRVIIRYDTKMFNAWVKRQYKTEKELRA